MIRMRKLFWTGFIAVVIGGTAFAVEQYRHSTQMQAQAATLSNQMRLGQLDGKSAPNFSLTDETGKQVTLSSLKGKVVVVQLMDPVCTDICPVVSSEIVGADRILGNNSLNVAFVTVNVNQYHESKGDLLQFSKQHGLSSLSNWYFLTGSTQDLKKVWQAYGITVVPNPDGDVQHSSFMYFIDKAGNERYIANPDNSKASISNWSNGIAFFANKLT